MSRGLAIALTAAGALLAAIALADEARAATVDVAIRDFAYQPQTIEAHAGDTIRWTNHDGASHTATSDQAAWDTGPLGTSGSSSIVFNTVGTYAYHCKIHPTTMKGTIRILEGVRSNTPPSILIGHPTHRGVVSGNVTIAGTASDPDGDPVNVTVRVGSGSFAGATYGSGGWTFHWDTRLVPNGEHSIAARASDGKEITSAPAISVTVDNPPTVDIREPAEGAEVTLGRVHTVRGVAWGAPGATLAIAVSVDKGTYQTATGTTEWAFSWRTEGLAPGPHTLRARVVDGARTIVSSVVNVTLVEPPPPAPNLPPRLTVATPAEGANVSGIVNVSGTASDPDGSAPSVRIDPDGKGWRDVSARRGSSWWYHWIPDSPPGPVALHVLATDGNASVLVTRNVSLEATPAALTLDTGATPREGRDVVVSVRSAAGAPVAGARVFLLAPDGVILMERVANATGRASLGELPPGAHAVRAYAPGAAGSASFTVAPRYDITVEPLRLDFDRLVAIRVNVSADGPVPKVPVHLTGDIIPTGATTPELTALDGTVDLGYQLLAAGELAVWVANNDTGIRVRVDPILGARWEPLEPVAGQEVRVRLWLNDQNATRLASASATLDSPGEPVVPVTTDPLGELVFTPIETGTAKLDVPYGEGRVAAVRIPIAPPPAVPELRDLAARPGQTGLLVSVIAKNAGAGNGSFVIDAVATGANGLAVQQPFRTRELAPGEEVEARFVLRLGAGDYTVTAAVRNSTALAKLVTRMPDVALPPPLTFDDEPPEEAPVQETPGTGAWAALAALAIVGLIRRSSPSRASTFRRRRGR